MSSTRALLISFSFGLPRQSRKLAEAKAEIELDNKAEEGVVSTPQAYYFRKKEGKKTIDGLKTLKDFQREWKTEIRKLARYPFASGVWILPASKAKEFEVVNESFKARSQNVIDLWVSEEYPNWNDAAPSRMGDLYDVTDFPTLQDCRYRFGNYVYCYPVLDHEVIQRVTEMDSDSLELVKRSQTEALESATRNVHQLIWNDVITSLNKVVANLSDPDGRIFDSLIANTYAVAEMAVTHKDVHKDDRLTEAAHKIMATVGSIKPQDLRKSLEEKVKAVNQARSIIHQYGANAGRIAFEE